MTDSHGKKRVQRCSKRIDPPSKRERRGAVLVELDRGREEKAEPHVAPVVWMVLAWHARIGRYLKAGDLLSLAATCKGMHLELKECVEKKVWFRGGFHRGNWYRPKKWRYRHPHPGILRSIPDGIEALWMQKLPRKGNMPLLPEGLRKLRLPCDDTVRIPPLPKSLQRLDADALPRFPVLPAGLKKLVLGFRVREDEDFGLERFLCRLPDGLEALDLRDMVWRYLPSLAEHADGKRCPLLHRLPRGLRHLWLPQDFEGPLPPLPEGLVSLTLGHLFDERLDGGSLPRSLRRLDMGSVYHHRLWDLPPGLAELRLSEACLPLPPLPESVVRLSLRNRNLSPVDLPRSLRRVDFERGVTQTPANMSLLFRMVDDGWQVVLGDVTDYFCKKGFSLERKPSDA